MTIIVTGVGTKRELKENPEQAVFTDPSAHQPINSGLSFTLSGRGTYPCDLRGTAFYCTNHPKRSWFAQVDVMLDGKVEIS